MGATIVQNVKKKLKSALKMQIKPYLYAKLN